MDQVNPEDIINLTSHLFHCSFSWSFCCLSSPLCMFPSLDLCVCFSFCLTIFFIMWHALISFLIFPKRGKVIWDGECYFIQNCHPCLAYSSKDLNQIRSVAQSCPTLCDPMNCSTPVLPVHHQLPEFTQTHVHWVSDAIQPSHPLSSHSPLAPNPSQHQSLFQWVNSSHEVAKVLEFQL